MAPPDEGAELRLVSAIRYKLANVSGDEEKLSVALQSQLVPLLEKAGSPHKAVRDAAFQAYISVTNFIKPTKAALPVAAILQQYKTTLSPVVKQLDLGLIKQGLPRLDQQKRRELLPILVKGISKETNPASAAGFFNIFLRLLLEVRIPSRGSKDDLDLRTTTGLADPADARYISTWLGKLFLLRQDLAFAASPEDIEKILSTSPIGLSKQDVDFLRNNNPHSWKPGMPNSLALPECKLKAVSFLASGAFTDDERYFPSVCASGSADSRITSVAEDILKRSNVSLEDSSIVTPLYEGHNSMPASHRIQILRLLSKSVVACSFKARIVEAVRSDFSLTAGEEPSVGGLEALRLHKSLLGFLTWVARNSSGSKVEDKEMGPSLVVMLKDFILRQGWPIPSFGTNQSQLQDEQRLRANAYETIGTLARGSYFETKAKESLLKWLFDSLVSDPTPDIVIHIEGALSSMMSLFKPTNELEHRDLEVLLLEYMTLNEQQGNRTAKHMAARFANNCLPFSNIKARWIDVLAFSCDPSDRRDIFDEGKRGLDPWWAAKLHPDEKLILPGWQNLTDMFFDATPIEVAADEMAIDQKSSYSLFPNERLRAFPTAVKFVKQMILLDAMGDSDPEVDWEARIENRLQNDLQARQVLRSYLASASTESLLKFLNAILDGLRDHPEVGAEDCVNCLANLLSFAPATSIIQPLCKRAKDLLPFVKSNNQKIRQMASKAFGILGPWDTETTTHLTELRTFLENNPDPSASQAAEYQGSLSFLGSYFTRAAYYGRLSTANAQEQVGFILRVFQSLLKKSDQSIQDTALDVVAQLWTANLHTPDFSQTMEDTLASLAKLASAGNERAIAALGRITIPLVADSELVGKVLEKLQGLFEIKRTEVHFAVGEAIAATTARWDSDAVKLSLDVDPQGEGRSNIIETLRKRPSQISSVLDKILEDCKTTKPSLLKASGIWLFCIIQYCSHLEEIQSRLRECQVAFTRLLVARDELVQETASRGLSLVYERGDAALKDDLVRDLVATFTGTKTQLKVDDETELFDAGALPTGEGKSVTSYKDIISLANEVGDQSLIYKFMALATNAATWTARSAFGRFGLSNILSDAELDPKIYPKLYRYRFDPNSNVRRSMDDIWKAVVKDSTAVIDQYFDAIMTDLLKSILDGREWRVREASCAAVAELVYGQPFPKYEKYYTDIWRVAMRVLDDQKATVRGAAAKLCMSLSKTLVTQLEENNSSTSARAMLSQVLPFLLSIKGIENSAEDVKILSIKTLLDVVKHGGDALKPFITTIINQCLGLLSTIEPDMIGYYYQRLGEEDREGLDKARSSFVTKSPIFECITNCLRFVDETVMAELIPNLIQTIKSALGMQTKVGCSEVLTTLALRHSILLPPYNEQLMKTMETQILDRNHEVNRSYARSAAYLLRTSSPSTRQKFVARLASLYFSAEDDTRRQKVADAVLAIAKVSPDVFNDLEAHLLPFSYLAKHDTDEYVAEEFEAVWSQHAGGSHTVMRYVDEIASFVSTALDTSKWALQHGAALAIASMINALSNAVGKEGQFNERNLQKIWPILDKALTLKTFKGKEKLVVAFPVFVQHSKQFWSTDATAAAQMKKIALREAKRNNEEYRPHAFQALGEFAAARIDLDMYQEVVSVVSDYLTLDGKAAHSLTELERKTAAAALKAVLTGWNHPAMESDGRVLLDIITTIEGAKAAISVAQDTWFTCAMEILNAAANTKNPQGPETGSRWFAMLVSADISVALESQRTARAKALQVYVKTWKRGSFGPVDHQAAFAEEMRNKVESLIEEDRSLDVQKILTEVLQELSA